MQWQPMTDVAATTTPHRAAAIRARLMGNPPRNIMMHPKSEPQKLEECEHVDWSALSVRAKCQIVLDNYIDGDTYQRLADRINEKENTNATNCALAGLVYRNKEAFAGVHFNSKGGGSKPRNCLPISKPLPTQDACAEAVARSTVIVKPEGERPQRRVFAERLMNAMCDAYDVPKLEILSRRRDRKTAFHRQKMIWVVKRLTPLSYSHIGRKFGGRDHTTVMHSIQKIDALIASNDPSVGDLKGWVSG